MLGKEETNQMKTPVMPDAPLDSREHAAKDEQSVSGRGAPMEDHNVSRRTLLKGGGAALAGLTVLRVAGPAHTFPGHSGHDDQPDPEQCLGHPGEEVIPWLDQPGPNLFPDNVGNLLQWEALDSRLIPTDNFFF